MNPRPAEIGDTIADIESPALSVDLDALNRDLVAMAKCARSTGPPVRPHAKIHNAAASARRQIANGAIGQCVRKVGEAEAVVRGDMNTSRARRAQPMRQRQGTVDAFSWAATGTFAFEAKSGECRALQVGAYAFRDTDYARIGSEHGGFYLAFEDGLVVLASVLSTPAADRAVVDADPNSRVDPHEYPHISVPCRRRRAVPLDQAWRARSMITTSN